MRFGVHIPSCLLTLVLTVAGASSAQTPKSGESALHLFRQGKESIEKQDWTRASVVLDNFISTYPKDKNIDQALYWLAFALKKQTKYVEAEQKLRRLLKMFPQSSWSEDAAVMQIELASLSGNNQAVEENIKQGDTESKVVALKSLFQTNPQRAFTFAETLFEPGSEAGPQLKRSVIALAGQHGSGRATALLTKVIDVESDPKLRRAAIGALGRVGDKSALHQLRTLANSSDQDTVDAALFAISEYASSEAQELLRDLAVHASSLQTRQHAIDWMGKKQGEAAVDQLMAIYVESNETEIRQQVLRTLSQIGGPRASGKLFDIARGGDEIGLRKQAVLLLGRQRDVQTVRGLIQLYNSATSSELKDQIVFSLRQSNHPEALEFLEGIKDEQH